MKSIKLLLCFILCISLTSCQSKVIQYTSEDASAYSLEKTKTTQAKMISVKTVNKDTIWTFQESFDRGLQWQVFDRHIMDSTSLYESNYLYNNYTVIVLDYYLTTNLQIKEFFDITYTYYDGYKSNIVFTSEYDSRESLKTKFNQFTTFMDYVKEQNTQYSDKDVDYDVIVQFYNHNYYIISTDDEDFTDVDADNMNYAFEYNLSELTKDYTDDEAELWQVGHQDSKIYVRENNSDKWGQTEFYSIEDHLSIASTVLYDILNENEYKGITLEGSRDNFTVKKDKKEYGPYSYEPITFLEAQKLTGMQYQIKANIKNSDTLSTNN